jgi:ADP-ribosylglycohydrolase
MRENAKAMVLASFAADSLALGAHWIYDTEQISRDFGRVDRFLKPSPDSYHPNKERGGFTHYGDQTFVLLQSLAAKGSFDLQDFSARWRDLLKDYKGYVDRATKSTLSQYASGKEAGNAGSGSDELAGASRIAPLVYRYWSDLDGLVQAVRAQTRMTHNNPLSIESADFFARVSWLVLNGLAPVEAMKKVSKEVSYDSPVAEWVEMGIGSRDAETVATLSRFGQSCHTESAFPGVAHLITKYEKDLEEALVQAVMAGGDSAARGMMVGMVLGAYIGLKSIPEKWLSELRKKEEILKLLEQIPSPGL